ncbi:DUF5777 family beta-barrel protein [Eudoraea sp.]|uniref:DUF5777 family beta-barrel protein n=1 Tax=Eudoraea sp. TaxID=1979955 RepID=UPI003C72D79A
MKNFKTILFIFLFSPFLIFSQKKEKDTTAVKLERAAFESAWIIDNPTNVLYSRNTMELQFAHRFGLVNGKNDLIGIWGASNIRIGVSYAILDRLTVGFGTSKFDRLQDFNWKVAILRQTRGNEMPVSVSYYGNFTIDARTKDNFFRTQDRYSFFHQVIIAKRFTPAFSLQIAPSLSHYNAVPPKTRNDKFAIAVSARLKVSPQTAIIVDYSQPFTHHLFPDRFYPAPGLSLGAEFRTSSHVFQVILSNYNGIVSQKNYMFNETNIDPFNGYFLIGFNMTRLYNF